MGYCGNSSGLGLIVVISANTNGKIAFSDFMGVVKDINLGF